ncbi:hypothetical protein HK104_001770 [Borealophlyctis nickersoniae]|nr:hypothetical protein HK104_001770 [Borealophlyctis nickersoniae]
MFSFGGSGGGGTGGGGDEAPSEKIDEETNEVSPNSEGPDSGVSDISPTSPEPPAVEDETPLTLEPVAMPGTETTCMHFRVRSKLGWVAWREMEASLYTLFEKAFAATRCEMKFSEGLDEFGFEVEIPNEHVDKFKKFFKSKTLPMEIDKLHGIDPISMNRRDAKLLGLKQTMGTTLKDTNVVSSIEVLEKRFHSLGNVGATRDKEVAAIAEQFDALRREMTKRFDDLQDRIQKKVYEAVGKKFAVIEKEIKEIVTEELSFLSVKLDPVVVGNTENTTS